MTDHILGLESLFSLNSPPGDHKKILYILIRPHIIKLLLRGNILVRFAVLLRSLRIKGFALIW